MRAARTQRPGKKTEEERNAMRVARKDKRDKRQEAHKKHKENEKAREAALKLEGKSKFERKDSNVSFLSVIFFCESAFNCLSPFLRSEKFFFLGTGTALLVLGRAMQAMVAKASSEPWSREDCW